jgi:hypothetical protein
MCPIVSHRPASPWFHHGPPKGIQGRSEAERSGCNPQWDDSGRRYVKRRDAGQGGKNSQPSKEAPPKHPGAWGRRSRIPTALLSHRAREASKLNECRPKRGANEILLAVQNTFVGDTVKPAIEWINGRPIQKLMPTDLHAILQLACARFLDAWVKTNGYKRGEVGTQWRFIIPPNSYRTESLVPDVACVSTYFDLPKSERTYPMIPRLPTIGRSRSGANRTNSKFPWMAAATKYALLQGGKNLGRASPLGFSWPTRRWTVPCNSLRWCWRIGGGPRAAI